MSEDGFIFVRVVEQLLAGHGPVLNVGERVEAATSPLWVLVLAVLDLVLPLRIEVVAVAAGLVLTLAGVAMAGLASLRLWRDEGGGRVPIAVPLGGLAVLALPPVWDFATSGLETGLSFAWLGASFLALTGLVVPPGAGASGRRALLAAALVGLGPLVRPDLALFSLVFLVAVVLVARRPRCGTVALVAAGGALPALYQVFRMGFFAALVPNTALAKEATTARWAQGLVYLRDLLGTYWLAVPLLAGLGLCLLPAARGWLRTGLRDHLLVALAPVAGALGHALYVVRVGGDFMHARLLLPALFALVAPVMVIVVRRPLQWAAFAAGAVWGAVCLTSLRVPYVLSSEGITDERPFYVLGAEHLNPVEVEDYRRYILFREGLLARRQDRLGGGTLGVRRLVGATRVYEFVPLRPDPSMRSAFAHGNVGIVGVVAGRRVHVVDIAGLGDPFAARVGLSERGRPGHEKDIATAWVLGRFMDRRVAPPAWVSPQAVEAARHALTCGRLRDLGEATTSPLTPGRFLSNIGAAVRLHSFRFDNDPRVAERVLCGAESVRSRLRTGPPEPPAAGGAPSRR